MRLVMLPPIVTAFCLAASLAVAERVTVEYEAAAGTVVGQPFGMTVPLQTTVRGYFSYETSAVDTLPADTMRGNFILAGTWDFRAEFLGRVVKGSGTATATTNLFGSPTLSFTDGVNSANSGAMTLDGTADATAGLNFRISGQAKDLPTDQLPARFTFNPPPGGASHTFVISNTSGQMLLQFRSFRQVDLQVRSITRAGSGTEIVWSSVGGKPYALEFSTDMVGWSIIRDDLVGNPTTTLVLDNLALRYPAGPSPEKGYYRVLDRGPQ